MSTPWACALFKCCTDQGVGTDRYGLLRLAMGRYGSRPLTAVRLAPSRFEAARHGSLLKSQQWFEAGRRATARRRERHTINNNELARATARLQHHFIITAIHSEPPRGTANHNGAHQPATRHSEAVQPEELATCFFISSSQSTHYTVPSLSAARIALPP